MTESTDPVTRSEAEVRARFAELQAKLPAMWRNIGREDPGGPAQEGNTIVVVPSLSIDLVSELPSPRLRAYEERLVFLLLLLAQPEVRIVYVSSEPVPATVVDYMLGLLPRVVASSARRRLTRIALHDGRSMPLSAKLLERPRALARIRAAIPDPDRAHMVPFTTTDLERRLAVALGIPMYAADPDLLELGTKSGGRRLFAEEGVPHPPGGRDLRSEDDLVDAVLDLLRGETPPRRAVAKLDEGAGGLANTTIDLADLVERPASAEPPGREAVRARVRSMAFEVDWMDYPMFLEALEREGGVVEAWLDGVEVASPSVQLRISPLGDVQILSTHDQMLGGPSGQSFLGARFPARAAYGATIVDLARRVGNRLAREGVLGRFAIDFVVARDPTSDRWTAWAIEINLRKGGTTTPYLTLQYLTDGRFDADEGVFRTARGDSKAYVSGDHLGSPALRALDADDLFDVVSRHRLHFDHARQAGVVLHMMSAVGTFGDFGVTAIGDDLDEAQGLYDRLLEAVEAEALGR